MNRATRSISALVLPFAISANALADDVYQKGSNGEMPLRPLKADVSILNVDNDKLTFRTRAGSDVAIAMKDVAFVVVSNDAVLTAADQAYVSRDYNAAVDGYSKILGGGGADSSWKIRYAASRSLEAAEKADRFDAAVQAWIAIARVDPKAVAARQPKLPARGSKLLDDAARQASSASQATRGPQRFTLLAFLLDVQLARGDATGIDDAVAQIMAAGYVAGSDPMLDAKLAEVRLIQAQSAYEAKKYDSVIATIDAASPFLVEPMQQAEALFLVAESRDALAEASGDAGSRRDAAIAYLRIVAHLSGEPSAAGFVTKSMLAAARLDTSVGDVAAARALYDQVGGEYPNSPAAAQAAALEAKLPAGQ